MRPPGASIFSRCNASRTSSTGGSGSYSEFDAVSQDDSTVVFSTTDQLVPADTDNQVDIYARTGTTTTLVSTGPNGGNGAFPATFGGASADASRIFFTTGEQLVSADTDSWQDVYEYSNGTTALISTGTTGGNGAYDAYFVGSSQDGSRRWFQTSEQLTSADTDICHGLTSEIPWDGQTVVMYHYVLTRDFPYTIACFRGKPTRNAFPPLPGAPPEQAY